ncbi:dienelactone hydrolase family protein [Sphingomonas sp.]|uniref:dienelactone hydrolase family protein n=1 Tax=Sphingomonas sp. TaxID=28214 RepID=UPI003B00BBB1
MDEELRRFAIAAHDRFTHEHGDRRRFMAEVTRLAGGAAAANLLVAGLAADPAAAALIPERDPRVRSDMVSLEVAPGRVLDAYRAAPVRSGTHPGVVVLHENRGLQPYTRDVARRLAVAGFVALAPDLLTPSGGTPPDEDRARAMIAALDLARTTRDATGAVDWLATRGRSTGKVGVVGFCWGGALADRVAVAADPAAAAIVSFYGPAPDPAEARHVRAPLLLHYAGLDSRVDASAKPWVEALSAAGKRFRSFTYPNVDHAFHNDTAPARYDARAATLAWDRTIAFLKENLA